MAKFARNFLIHSNSKFQRAERLHPPLFRGRDVGVSLSQLLPEAAAIVGNLDEMTVQKHIYGSTLQCN